MTILIDGKEYVLKPVGEKHSCDGCAFIDYKGNECNKLFWEVHEHEDFKGMITDVFEGCKLTRHVFVELSAEGLINYINQIEGEVDDD
jgi:hypothetical protein